MPDWRAIMARDGPAVWRTAYRILGHRADADDCFQEAFLDALAVSRREPVRDWQALLKRLAAARAIDRLRQRKRRDARREVADCDELGGDDESPSRRAEDAEILARLRSALATIPPKQAEAFCLHYLEGWSYREIASHLAASVDAVGVLLHRARKLLRERLGGPLGAPEATGEGTIAPRKEDR